MKKEMFDESGGKRHDARSATAEAVVSDLPEMIQQPITQIYRSQGWCPGAFPC